MASLTTKKEIICADMDEYDRLKIHFNNARDNNLWTAEWDDAGWSAVFSRTEEFLF